MEITIDEQHLIDSIKQSLSRITTMEIEDTGKFKNRPEVFLLARRMIWLAKLLLVCSFNGIPMQQLNELSARLREVLENLTDIDSLKKFTSEDTLANSMIDLLNRFWNDAMTCVNFGILCAGEQSALQTATRITELELETIAKTNQLIKQAEESVAKVALLYGQTVIAKHAGNFKTEVENQTESSKTWLEWAMWSATALVLYAEIQHFYAHQFLTSSAAQHISIVALVEMAGAKLVVISLLTYALVTCVRNYSAARHNIIVNRHRMNALSSFETFAAAAEDKEAKAAVLIEATKAVFAPQQTGLLKNEATPEHGAQIIEIIKSIK